MDVFGRGTDRHASAAADIIADDDGRSLEERIDTAAWAILNGAQDAVMEILAEQWPLAPNGSVVDPQARIEDDRLLMWFGEEKAPVVALPPLKVRDVLESAT